MKRSNTKPQTPLPLRELRRYGFRKALNTPHFWLSLIGGILLELVTSGLPRDLLQSLFAIHLALMSVSFAVFGFFILGGKDDFLDFYIQSKGVQGAESLRRIVLYVFFPIVLHAICVAALLIGMAFRFLWRDATPLAVLFRVSYLVIGLWSIFQTYYAIRTLFSLAIIRILWRSTQSKQSPPLGDRTL